MKRAKFCFMSPPRYAKGGGSKKIYPIFKIMASRLKVPRPVPVRLSAHSSGGFFKLLKIVLPKLQQSSDELTTMSIFKNSPKKTLR